MLRRCFVVSLLFLLIITTTSFPQTKIVEVQSVTVSNETITTTIEDGSLNNDGINTAPIEERHALSKPVSSNLPIGMSMTNNILLHNTTNKNFRGHKKVQRTDLKILNKPHSVKFVFPNRENERPVVYQSGFSGIPELNRRGYDSPIVFPNENKQKPINFIPKGKPKCADKNTYCVDAEDYPLNFVKDLANRRAIKDFGLFGSDVLPTFNISQRIDDTKGDELVLCQSNEEVVFPQAAQNKDDKWLFIFNDNEKFVQGVRIEKCVVSENSPCRVVNPVSGYTFQCRQKYIYRKLVALGDEGSTYVDSFRLPSCCSCYAKADNGRSKRWY